jgi:serine phosphatase RsbU (regulator of sigma subunit)/biopolymer transport protein ExbD
MEIKPTLVLLILLAAFFILILFATIRLIAAALPEKKRKTSFWENGGDFFATLTGRFKNQLRNFRHGMGLHHKLSLFTIVLVLVVIFTVSIPFYYMMVKEQEKTMLKGLWDRSVVLLEGLSASTQFLIQADSEEELNQLTARIASIPEARYLTITGFVPDSAVYEDRVWASNDPGLLFKINTPRLQPGVSLLRDTLTTRLDIRQWPEISGKAASEPEFSFNYNPGNHNFLFYMPVMFWLDVQNNYFCGLLRLEVSIDSIKEEMQHDKMFLERTILLITLAVLAFGIFCALILSSLIIMPIQKLANHVQIFRDTKDKKNLIGMEIKINTHDEIAMLGATINEMIQELALAATTESELSIGKEIQKKFLPLELDKNGDKLSSGYKETADAFFFGYYVGVEGISGDYFDYHDLDGRYYAIIKCDVAGEGIPAALIMIQVATMFLNYFKDWKPDADGMKIEKAVYQINDFIETLGFQGRFAAFSLCIFDSQTGDLRFCNAGDNIIHIFDSSERRIKNITLPQTPAAGVLSNSMVESKGGYQVQNFNLKHGDILLLYTDGIEDSKRKFRDSEYNETTCNQGPAGTPHGNHFAGEKTEVFGSKRVSQIVNAVMNQGTYRLFKWHNPEDEQYMDFDFSGCNGGVDQLILALIAVEKMFRCEYERESAKSGWVMVEKKIDNFLKEHLIKYQQYCGHSRECAGNNAYMYYTHLREYDQYDDLTILGVKRK